MCFQLNENQFYVKSIQSFSDLFDKNIFNKTIDNSVITHEIQTSFQLLSSNQLMSTSAVERLKESLIKITDQTCLQMRLG